MAYIPVPEYSPGVSGGTLTSAGLRGVADGSNANVSYVGEIQTYSAAPGSAVALTNDTYANVLTISLNAGDWDLTGIVTASALAVTGTYFEISWGTTSATPTGSELDAAVTPTMPTANCGVSLPLPMYTISVAGATNLYVVTKMKFSAGSPTVYCGIRARRRR